MGGRGGRVWEVGCRRGREGGREGGTHCATLVHVLVIVCLPVSPVGWNVVQWCLATHNMNECVLICQGNKESLQINIPTFHAPQ